MNRKLALGLSMVAVFLFIAALGTVLAPYSPFAVSGQPLTPPGFPHVMGTDHLGRDIFSRILSGARTLMVISFLGSVLGTALGVVVGQSGYFDGRLDVVLSRIVDLLLSIPVLLTGLLIITAFGNETVWLVLGMGFIFMPRVARVIRGAVMGEATKEYIEAARAIGASTREIVLRHILPNISNIIVVEATTRFAQAILLVAALSFLGLGTPLSSPDWGRQISDARDYILVAPWMVLFPSMAISLLVISVNLIADGLQENHHGSWIDRKETNPSSLRRMGRLLSEEIGPDD